MIEDVVRRLVDYERKLEDEVVQTLVIDWLRRNGWKVERDG